VITGVVIVLADKAFGQYIPQLTVTNSKIAVWKTLLASLYGGIVEEILMRLFLVSLLAWLLGKIFRSTEVVKNNLIMWTAIILAAILFGLGHLPITASITQITPIVLVRAIVLNGIGGLVFGWLYWKKGLEHAIVAHFSADIVLLAILPALLK
jgi:membrane protease YdiL (CAAX protease family)